MNNTQYLTDFLQKNANQMPDKPFLIFKDTSYSYRAICERVQNLAKILSEKLSNKNQQIVGLLLPNTPDFVVAYLAIVHAGHIAMPLDPNFKKAEVTTVVDQMKPEFTITNINASELFDNQVIYMLDELERNTAKDAVDFLRLDPRSQYVSMLFTSGTTGNPKATPYSHANHLWNIEAVSNLWQWSSEDTLLISLALSHWHGLCVGLTGALVNGNTIYLQEWFDPGETLTMLTSGKISLFMHVPVAYSKIIEHKKDAVFDISNVRLCISGSSYLPPAMWQQFKDRFGHEILERYGASEMGFLTSNRLDSRTPGCVGWPLDGVTIKIQEDGEIAMNSPGLFNGYWNNDIATKEHQTEDGLWLSGDIGEFDDQGRLHLKGRVQEKMKKLGYTVYPRDVEWALMQNPKITDAVVMSIQSTEKLSDDFVYFIVGNITEQEVTDYCKQNLPNYWRPDVIRILESIPRTGRAAKPALRQLREMITHK